MCFLFVKQGQEGQAEQFFNKIRSEVNFIRNEDKH